VSCVKVLLLVRTFIHTTLFWSYVALTLPAWFVFLAIVWLVTLPFDRHHRLLHLGTCAWGAHIMFLHPLWRLKIEGRRNVRRDRPYIYASNHQSAGDITVLLATFLPFKFVSKHANFRIPFLGWAMSLNRYVKIERGSLTSARKMMDACRSWLKKDVPVMMFPEGTRSLDGRMLPFRLGTFQLAKETGVHVVPVVLDNTLEALPKSGLLVQKGVLDVRVMVGEPIDPADFPDARSLANAVRAKMHEMQSRIWRERGYAGPAETVEQTANVDAAAPEAR
jgi:1-acyl-sn-glycerol-3-phosphate acyltransferase